MKNTELRIGNLINYEQTTHIIETLNQEYCTSKWIDDDICNPYVHNYDNIEPIPLTEEWLIKIGSTKHESAPCKWYQLRNSYIEIQYYVDKSNGKSGWVLFDKETEMKAMIYVHQLQNLYFALTNEELK
jgi:hypothetical protein